MKKKHKCNLNHGRGYWRPQTICNDNSTYYCCTLSTHRKVWKTQNNETHNKNQRLKHIMESSIKDTKIKVNPRKCHKHLHCKNSQLFLGCNLSLTMWIKLQKTTHEVTITVKQSMQVLDKMTKSPLMASIMTMHAFKGMSSSSLFFGLLQHDVIVYQTNYKTILWSFCKVLLQLTKT